MSTIALLAISIALGAVAKECKRSKGESGDDNCNFSSNSASPISAPASITSNSPGTKPNASGSLTSAGPAKSFSTSQSTLDSISMSSSATLPTQNSTHGPSLEVPTPHHNDLATAAIVALVLGIFILLLFVILILLLLRRRRRGKSHHASQASEIALERGEPRAPIKYVEGIIGEKGEAATSVTSPPCTISFNGTKSRNSRCTSRLRTAFRVKGVHANLLNKSSQNDTQSGTGPIMSEARQGLLVSVLGGSCASSAPPSMVDSMQSPPSLVQITPVILTSMNSADSTASAPSVSSVSVARPVSVVVRDSDSLSIGVDYDGRRAPPTYDSLMSLARV